MKENLIKCTVITENGLIVECELSHKTIKELENKESCISSQGSKNKLLLMFL